MASRLLTLLFFAALFAWTLEPPLDYDLWFDLRMGREIASTGQVPHYESFLPAAPKHYWVNDEWGFSFLVWHLYQLGGCPALALAKSAVIAGLFFFLYRGMRLAGLPQLPSLGMLVLAYFLMRSRFMLRPQLMTDMLLAGQVWLLLRREQGWKTGIPWIFAPFYALWGNLHAGFLAGIAVLGAFTLGEALQRRAWKALCLSLGLAVLAVMARPGGWTIYGYLGEHFGGRRAMMDVNIEWLPLSTQAWLGAPGLLLALAVAGFALAARHGQLRWAHLLATGGVFYMAASHNRSVGELAAVAPPLVAWAWMHSGLALRAPRWLTPAGQVLAAVAAALVLFQTRGDWRKTEPPLDVYPEGAIPQLEDARLVLNSYHFGGYLVFRDQPAYIHGMTATYPDQLLFDYLAILRGEKAVPEIDRYLLHYAPPQDVHAGAARRLWDDPEWGLDYFDDVCMVYGKGAGRFQSVNPALQNPFPGPGARAELLWQVRTHPDVLIGWKLLGELERREKRYPEAEKALQEVLQRDPENAPAWLSLGQVRFEQEDVAGAVAALERAVTLDPSAPAHFNLAVALFKTGQMEAGKRELERALERDPTFLPALRLKDQL